MHPPGAINKVTQIEFSMESVVVGLSGGVDSSVTALLLKQQGYAVQGLFMKNWNEDDGTEYCTARQDLEDALRVCDKLDIELHTVNFAREYWDNVFAHFLREYSAGRTPNPDVLCNREIKFKAFAEHASRLGADWIATGHYARIEHGLTHSRLRKGLDANKDQSYFLNAVPREQFRTSLFPLGSSMKPLVRKLARTYNLVTHDKKDSTGLCFIGERRFADFLRRYVPATPGPIISIDGATLGEHQGTAFYTIGQRQGIGIGGRADAGE
jgi:tRNA-specific 2-thiouridylase